MASETSTPKPSRRRSPARTPTRAARKPSDPSQAPTAAAASEAPAASHGGAATTPPIPGLAVSPTNLLEIQSGYLSRLSTLWTDMIERPERIEEPIDDPRFSDPAWRENAVSSFLARSYLINAEYLGKLCGAVEADAKTKARLAFAVSQWIDAAAPSNYLALNPKAQKRLLETQGKSLSAGLNNLMGDLAKGKITQADESAFEVGVNVATTEGAVVFENDTIQLIQYKPLTEQVRSRPFLIVPPCINKFYILDLQAQNSFVRFAVEKGNTVFLVSWKNPGEAQSHWTWDHYVEHGPIRAIRAVCDISRSKSINILGFCVGGTLVASALAVLAARGEAPAHSLTLLTSLLDFSDSGVLDIFIDEAHVSMREATLGHGGLMPGRDLANTFSSLRANDLVWNYVVNNYLEGQRPPAFDLLYWNSDSTSLPGPMYAWYLRHMYLQNDLCKPGVLQMCGEPVDLGSIHAPCYVFAAREDHIVPWTGAYASARTLTGVAPGQLRFVLGASGHIAGTINPASKNRRNYWLAPEGQDPGVQSRDPQAWFDKAVSMPGSWWNDWDAWLAPFGGELKAAPKLYGGHGYREIEAAPGRFVKERS